MLGATAAGVLLAPLAVPVCVVADVVRLRFRLPTLRTYLFLLQYGVNDSVEILLAPLFWLRAGCGTRLGREPSLLRHERVQRWSVLLLARRAEQLLGLRLTVDPASAAALAPGPAIVLCRHVNLVDASLPGLLALRQGMRMRGVIMAELLADPGFDLFYGRTGSVFIPREDGPAARAACRALGASLGTDTLALIYPEGRLFRPDRLARSLDRLTAADPARAERLAALRHVLPPRPGGVSALLDAAPDADVVVVAHAGLDRFPTFAALGRAVPLRAPVEVLLRRIPRSQIPDEPLARTAWLDAVWCEVDDWVDARLTARSGPGSDVSNVGPGAGT